MTTQCDFPGIEQTLFLGCTIQRFSCNLGFNEQPTEINVRIVEDNCSSPVNTSKVYYDSNSSVNNFKKSWTGPDPGFYCFGANKNEPPRLGAPVYFRFGDFEFMGLLQSWTKVQTKSDVNVYDLKLVSPVEILQGCQLIIGDYTGPIKGFNIFNVYGFQEIFSPHSLAPLYIDPRYTVDGSIMGSFANAFGGANANKVGMTWNKIKEGLEILTSSLISAPELNYEEYSQNGRITYYGAQANANFGLVPYDDINLTLGLTFSISSNLAYYYLDISELPEVPDEYRVAGPSISILSLISQICNDFGMDYYLELVPVQIGGNIAKIIKIRTILRNIQPDTTIIQSYIDAAPEVIDSTFGRELRNETTTNFLVGGQKQSVWQVENGLPDPKTDPEENWLFEHFGGEEFVRDRIVPYFGQDTFGDAYVLHTTSGTHIVNGHLVANLINNPTVHYINFDFRNRHNWIILDDLLPDTLPVTIGEMRAAAQGYDGWSLYSKIANTSFNQYITGAGYDINTIFNPNIINNPNIQARDVLALYASKTIDQFTYEMQQYVRMIGEIYTQSKQTFMVRAPWLVARYSIDRTTIANSYADLGVLYTDEPCEGGWTEAENVLLLPNPSTYIDRMRNQDGTIKPFAFFDLPDDVICHVISGTGQISGPAPTTDYQFANGTFRTVPTQIGTECRSISQTSQTLTEFNTPESFAVDRTLILNTTGEGKLLYYGFKQELEPVFLDRVNLVSPRVIIQFSQPLDFYSDTPGALFNANGWNFNSMFLQGNVGDIIAKGLSATSSEKELLIHLANPPVREPDAVAVMLKSNVMTYGPWKPNNIIEAGPPGQISFQKEDDLVPWTFGSYQNLNNIAQIRANESVTVMSEGEVGSITIFGAPNIPLGAELASLKGLIDTFYPNEENLVENRSITFTTATLTDSMGATKTFNLPSITLGSWNGSFGPTVTSINVDVSNDTINTVYSFRTFTPKFGVMSKLNAQRLEQRYIYENHRRAYLRYIDESRRVQQAYLQSLRQLTSDSSDKAGVKSRAGTPHSVLVGQMVPWGATSTGTDVTHRRNIIATKNLYELQNNLVLTGEGTHSYDSMAIMSFDGLIRPVSLTGGGGLPRFYKSIHGRNPSIDTTTPPVNGSLNSPRSPFWSDNTGLNLEGNTAEAISPMFMVTGYSGNRPPTGGIVFHLPTQAIYKPLLTTDYFNPFSNPSGFLNSSLANLHDGTVGHDIDILARNNLTGFNEAGRSLVLSTDKNATGQNGADYTDDYRFLALRGPLVIHGWGYDTNGKPIPNAEDDEIACSGGYFDHTSLQDKFLPDFLKKSHTWPLAPVDLRFDRRRGMWVAPPPYPIISANLMASASGDDLSCPITSDCSGWVDTFFNSRFDDLVYGPTGQVLGSSIIPICNPSIYNEQDYYIGDDVLVQYQQADGRYHIISAPPQNPWKISIGACVQGAPLSGNGRFLVYNPTCLSNIEGFSSCGNVAMGEGPELTQVTAIVRGADKIDAGQNAILIHNKAFGHCANGNNIKIIAVPFATGNVPGITGVDTCCDSLPDWVKTNPTMPQPPSEAGCGITIAGSIISVDPTVIVGPGLQLDPTSFGCSIAVYAPDVAGCGLKADPADGDNVKISIDAGKLAGIGLAADSTSSDNATPEANACALGLNRNNFTAGDIQLYGHAAGTLGAENFTHNTVGGWLTVGLDVGGFNFSNGSDQVVGHYNGVAPSWMPAGQVKVSDPDGLEYLVDKMKDTSTYDSSTHQLVYAQEVDSTPSKNIRFFTAKGGGASTSTILITGDVNPAVYTLGTLTPDIRFGSARLMEGSGLVVSTGADIILVNYYTQSLAASKNHAYIGEAILITGSYYKLLINSCEPLTGVIM